MYDENTSIVRVWDCIFMSKEMLPHECNLFFYDFIQTMKGLHRGSPIVVLPNTKTLNIQLTIRKYIQQQAKETIIGKLNLLYGMTTNLNKRFIFNLIHRLPAPGYEADLLYTQCSLMPGSLSEKPRFSQEGVWA